MKEKNVPNEHRTIIEGLFKLTNERKIQINQSRLNRYLITVRVEPNKTIEKVDCDIANHLKFVNMFIGDRFTGVTLEINKEVFD